MRILITFALLAAMIFAVGCDEGQQMAMNVVSEPVASDIIAGETIPTETVVSEPVATEPEYTELTYENALDLQPGVYRMRPNDYYNTSGAIGDEDIISDLIWGNISDFDASLIEGTPPDAPKVLLSIELDPKPFDRMLDGRKALEIARPPTGGYIIDEVLVEIGEKIRESVESGGTRGNRFEFTIVVYTGKLISNLTNPDRVFEYE